MRTCHLFAVTVLLAASAASAAPATQKTVDPASTSVVAVQLSATTSGKTPQIELRWEKTGMPTEIGRRLLGEREWKKHSPNPVEAATDHFVDTKVEPGKVYEYCVVSVPPKAIGYIASGIDAPPVESRGKLLLIVDSAAAKALPRELTMLQYDLVGDGWEVVRHDVARDLSVTKVKEFIAKAYADEKAKVRCVYLFGHVPVPYSGNLAPDGHPDHQGAWPADGYYACMDGVWTDTSVTTPETTKPRQKNVPGDGRFDQSSFPADLELEIGRVDLAGMSGFNKTEVELLAAYLRKSHDYRHARRTYPLTAAIADNFGHFGGRAFAATGFRSFPPLVGAARCTEYRGGDLSKFAPAMAERDWLWAYGCGPGHFGGASGVIAIDSFRNAKTRAPFWVLFGSYFGDWDAPDTLLKAPLAGSDGLACCWSGFPMWFFHPMGMGQTLGYCARLSMNNSPRTGGYTLNAGARGVHMALMGDPTLRLYPVVPPAGVFARNLGQKVLVGWTAAAQKPLGYHVYRADTPTGPFTRLTTEPVTTDRWQDPSPSKSTTVTYMVRSLVLQVTPSGSFYNLSQGAFDNTAQRGSEPAK